MIDRTKDLVRAARHYVRIAQAAARHGHHREARQWAEQAAVIAGSAGLDDAALAARAIIAGIDRQRDGGAA